MTHEQETARVRKWNRELIRSVLCKDTIREEPQKPFYNLKSQILLRSAMECIRELYQVAYEDPVPGGSLMEMHRQEMKRTSYTRYQEAIMEYNFIAARRILFSVLEHCHTEQKYDLSFLLGFDFKDLDADDLYSIGAANGI